jgi:hypothetical protein
MDYYIKQELKVCDDGILMQLDYYINYCLAFLVSVIIQAVSF